MAKILHIAALAAAFICIIMSFWIAKEVVTFSDLAIILLLYAIIFKPDND